MTTIIAPIIKNKSGDLPDNNNYRPIALATVASKLFESLILSRATPFLITCDNQFELKKHHSTEMLIFLLKELFRNYIANGSSMYVTMLDASKAFDKVNHSKLFDKLIDRGCPAFIVRIIYHWYGTQQFTIRWYQGFSSFFTVSNGVKQGRILSPHLFNVYMDDLSVNLNKLHIGCLYAGTLINHCMLMTCIFLPVSLVWKNLLIVVPSMANCSILLMMPRSPFVWLLTTNPRTGKMFIVPISITIHYLILRNVNILVI